MQKWGLVAYMLPICHHLSMLFSFHCYLVLNLLNSKARFSKDSGVSHLHGTWVSLGCPSGNRQPIDTPDSSKLASSLIVPSEVWKIVLHTHFKIESWQLSLAFPSPSFSPLTSHASFLFYFSKTLRIDCDLSHPGVLDRPSFKPLQESTNQCSCLQPCPFTAYDSS